jgi:flagellar basal body-associated protein FliL
MSEGAGIAVICVIVLVVLAIIGCLVYVFVIRGKKDKGAASPSYDMGDVNTLSSKQAPVVKIIWICR